MTDLSGLDRIRSSREALARALYAGCQEYANGGFRGQPIVASHFTAGNQGRYGWAALDPDYARAKEGQTKTLKKDMKLAGQKVPAGKGLPMLVRSGKLRNIITSGKAVIRRTGPDSFLISWENNPPYALYLHEGTDKMPKRSPVEPNTADKKAIIEAARRHLSASIGTGGPVPLGRFGGRARVG